MPRKSLRLSVAGDGSTVLAGVLDAEGGAQFRTVLEAIADQLWRAEREDGQVEKRPANLNERLRAEALEEMVRRATAADPERTGARPLLSVIIDLPTLEGRAGCSATPTVWCSICHVQPWRGHGGHRGLGRLRRPVRHRRPDLRDRRHPAG